jgi:hypothetical protein
MTVSPRVWLVTFVSLVFVIGVSAGVLVDRTWLIHDGRPFRSGPGGPGGPDGRGPGGPGGPGRGLPPLIGPSSDRLIEDLDNELHLTAEQRQKIQSILEAHRPQVRALQDDARKKFTDEQQKLQDEIAATLTKDQATHFLDLMARRPLDPGGPGRRGGPRGGPGHRDGRE